MDLLWWMLITHMIMLKAGFLCVFCDVYIAVWPCAQSVCIPLERATELRRAGCIKYWRCTIERSWFCQHTFWWCFVDSDTKIVWGEVCSVSGATCTNWVLCRPNIWLAGPTLSPQLCSLSWDAYLKLLLLKFINHWLSNPQSPLQSQMYWSSSKLSRVQVCLPHYSQDYSEALFL